MAHTKNKEQQFIVSKELLQLLKWLVEHEPENVKKFVQQAIDDGLCDEMQSHQEEASYDEMQQSVVDFFSLLENILHEIYHDESSSNSQRMFPALNHIDSHVCDHNTLAVSAAKASSLLQDATQEPTEAKEALCKALITYWNPRKSKVVH